MTISINIQLTYGSRKTVASTRFHNKKSQTYQKIKYRLVSLSNPIQSKTEISYMYMSIQINCLLTEAIIHWWYMVNCWEHALADETTFLKAIFDKLQNCSKEWELKTIIWIQTRDLVFRTNFSISPSAIKISSFFRVLLILSSMFFAKERQ